MRIINVQVLDLIKHDKHVLARFLSEFFLEIGDEGYKTNGVKIGARSKQNSRWRGVYFRSDKSAPMERIERFLDQFQNSCFADVHLEMFPVFRGFNI